MTQIETAKTSTDTTCFTLAIYGCGGEHTIGTASTEVASYWEEEDEIFQLKYFSNTTLSSEFSILEVRTELLKFIKITSKMNSFLKSLILETDKRKFSKILQKIKQYEDITDRIEDEVSEYLSKVNETESTQKTNEEIKSILSIINDLESIGDSYYSISKLIQRKSENNIFEIGIKYT